MSPESSTSRPPDRVRIAAWPYDVRPGEVDRNLDAARDGLERAAAAGAALLLLPEKWTTSYLPHYDAGLREASAAALDALHAAATQLGVTVVGSAIAGAGERPFNEQHVLGPGGDVRPYRKRLLFSPADEAASCAPGAGLPRTVPTPAGLVAAVICYDLRFPELCRPAFYQGADVLVVPAEWPSARSATFELLARARAAENQCWVVTCNRTGSIDLHGEEVEFPGTALIVDPLGNIAGRSDGGALLVGELDHALTRETRAAIPCARDLEQAGLLPASPDHLGMGP